MDVNGQTNKRKHKMKKFKGFWEDKKKEKINHKNLVFLESPQG